MNSRNVLKLLGLIAGIALLNIIVFSPGLLGIQAGGGNALETASAITLWIISLLALLYGSYTLVLKPPVRPRVTDIQTHEDYVHALQPYRHIKSLKDHVSLALDQLERMDKKQKTFLEILAQRFDPAELSYKKFRSVIEGVQSLFYLNMKGILNKLHVFDPSEFSRFAAKPKDAPFSNQLVQKKSDLYKEYVAYITGYLEANEEISLKLDKLLLEMSLLGSTDYKEIEEMPCMKEIDALIGQTKYYKQ